MRDEIPGAALQHEPERVDRALDDSAALPIPDPRPVPLPDGGRELRQMRHGVLRAKPAARVEMEEPRRARRPLLQLLRKRRQQLEARGRELTAEAELGGRARHPGGEERLGLVARQPGQPRAVAAREPVTARRAAHGLHRHAGGCERLDVAMDRPDRDLEPLRHLGRREQPARLEQEQERDEPGCAHVRRSS